MLVVGWQIMGTSSPNNTGPRDVAFAHHFQALLRRLDLTPRRIAVIYLVFGLTALYVSDVLFVQLFDDPFLQRVQGVKGFVEVLLTTGLIFGLTTGGRAPLEAETDRLQRQREELQVLHRVMRHNLRNDLNTIQGYAELIHDDTEDERRQEWCRAVMESVSKLLHYTEQANRIRQISDRSNGRQTELDLAETIPRIIETNTKASDAGSVTVDLPDEARVEANHMLDVAIDELVTNAIKHNDDETPEVAITVEQAHGPLATTLVIVEDNGPGLSTNTLEVFEQAKEEPLLHMNGMGLWLVYWTVTESNGSMEIESSDDGTRITLTVPSAMEMSTASMAQAFG